MDEIELSIIAPMFNEEENIEGTVESIKSAMASFEKPWEMVFVNDGSTDGTLEKARGIEKTESRLKVISYPVNCGRGKAIKTGFANARGKYIVTVDFDLSYSPDHIIKIYQELTNPFEMNDVVLASAYMKGGRVEGVSMKRLLISRLGNVVLKYAFPKKFDTSTCIVRGYKKEVIESISIESDRKEIHLEILSKVCVLGYRVKEIPAVLRNRKKGGSKFKFKSTAFTHILFTLFEKPILIFGAAGVILDLAGLLIGVYVLWLRFSGNLSPDRPLIPLMILLLVVGTQCLSFAFIASQNIYLRNEIYRLQRRINLLNGKSDK